jgi:3-deoxy-D-manno-octulosonic-acid transferase
MSQILYRFIVCLYILGIRVASLFNKKAKLWVRGRINIFDQLSSSFAKNKNSVIWMHCASLGEFEQGRTILEAIKKQNPETKILLTFFSPSGYEIRKNYPLADWVYYLPADSPGNAKKFIEIIKPSQVIFVKYEFWYYYLRELKKQQIPTYLISAIFREKQTFFSWYGGLFREMLFCFNKIFVQDKASAQLLEGIDYKEYEVTGDSRLDRVTAIKKQAKTFPVLETFSKNAKVIICGSTWPADEKILSDFAKNNPDYKLVIAPHQIDGKHLKEIADIFDFTKTLFYSQNPDNSELKEAKILIIDNIGMLSSLYYYGHIAYIGGGFGAGIHNILEAVVYEIPVVFGGNYHKFREAVDLIEAGVAFEISDQQTLTETAVQISENSRANKIKEKIAEYLKKNTGATEKILNGIKEGETLKKI